MKPGDIVLMTPQPTAEDAGLLTRMGANVFGAVSGAIQGKYTHAGIYAGNGKVIDIRAETGVRKVPLKELTKDLSIAVVRPNVHARVRSQAVQKAEGYYKNRDKIEYHVPDLIPAAASAFLDIGEKPINENQVICSSMVANAFGKHKIAPGVARHATKPVDFLKSPRVKYVGDYDVKKVANVMPLASTLAMDVGSQAKHLTRMGREAIARGIPREVVAARNAEMRAMRPVAHAATPVATAPVAHNAPAPSVATKKTPTQSFDRLALSRHLASTNPTQAVQAGLQHGMPVVATPSVLDQLSQMSFFPGR